MQIKTIIFDLVDVFICYPWKEWAIATYGEENFTLLDKAFWQSGNWKALDQGICTPETFLEKCYDIDPLPEHKALYKDALYRIGDCASIFPYVIPWIQELKRKGYQVLFLSNYTTVFRDSRPDVLKFLSLMDGGLFSFDAHLTKPDSRIYQMLCEKYQLQPEECLFIDDNAANIDAARRFGLHGIQFLGYETSYDVIMQYIENI